MGRVYSHSRLACFENCPKRFHYRYVLGLPAETESVEAFLGRRVHEVLERLHRFVQAGRIPALPAVVRRYHAEWERHFDAERVRIARREMAAEHYREVGERCLNNHYRRHYPFDGEETLGIEQRVSFPLDAERGYRVQGVIDRVVRARDGALEIHDYKTSGRIPRQRALDEDRQLAFYQLGLNGRAAPEAPVRLVWHYLVFDQVRTSTRTTEQLDALRERTLDLIERVEAEQDFAPRPGPLCAWCEWSERCPASAAAAGRGARSEAQPSEVHELGASEPRSPDTAASPQARGARSQAQPSEVTQPGASEPRAPAPSPRSVPPRLPPPPAAPPAQLALF